VKKLLILLFIPIVCFGQKEVGLEICFEYQKSLRGFSAEKEANDALNEILAVIGAAKNFYLIPCDEINNALALTYKGERYIMYDKDFINKINKATNNWSGKFILAHEVGHHINGHTRDFLIASMLDDQTKEKQREEELEADVFAGFIVAKLGASYNQIKKLMETITSEKDDKYSTHPNRTKRLEAIKRGFGNAQVNLNTDLQSEDNTSAELLPANSVIFAYINAIGGSEAINSVNSVMMFGNVTIEGMTFKPTVTIKKMSPNMSSMEMSIAGMGTVMKQKYNGITGYSEQQGTKAPMSENKLSEKAKEKVLFPEIYLDINKIKLVGLTDINGTEVFKVKVNDYSFRYYNTTTGLLVRTVKIEEEMGRKITSIADLSDYRDVNGVLFPYTHKLSTVTSDMYGNPMTDPEVIQLNFSDVVVNSGVSYLDFK
jgi:hypothetical protein